MDVIFLVGFVLPFGTAWVIYDIMSSDLKEEIYYEYKLFAQKVNLRAFKSPRDEEEAKNKIHELEEKLYKKKIKAFIIFLILFIIYGVALFSNL